MPRLMETRNKKALSLLSALMDLYDKKVLTRLDCLRDTQLVGNDDYISIRVAKKDQRLYEIRVYDDCYKFDTYWDGPFKEFTCLPKLIEFICEEV